MAKRRVRGTIVQENVQTGDGRVIAQGAITWAPLPLPLGFMADGGQHTDLVTRGPQVGTIDTLDRQGDDVVFTGSVDDANPDGAELIRRMEAGTGSGGTRYGISIDPDDWQVQIVATDTEDEDGEPIVILAGAGPTPERQQVLGMVASARADLVTAAAGDPDPGDEGTVLLWEDASDTILERYTRLRIRGATACPIAAFTGAFMELAPDDDGAPEGEAPADDEAPADEPPANASISASAPAVPARAEQLQAPPAEWFSLPEPQPGDTDDGTVYGMPVQELLVEQPDGGLAVPLTITDDGRVFGHAARWGQCHVGYPGACVTAPESLAGYAHFHVGVVHTADGQRIATGPLTVGCDHAAAELLAPEARDHYAHAGMAWADVRASNGSLGVWVSGALRPDVADSQLRVLRASTLSGDWRRIGTDLEFIGALAVNVPGFPIAREAVVAAALHALAASRTPHAQLDADRTTLSLVAAGQVHRCPECQRRATAAADHSDAWGALLEVEPDPRVDELLSLVRALELRTRHLQPDAAQQLLARIRR